MKTPAIQNKTLLGMSAIGVRKQTIEFVSLPSQLITCLRRVIAGYVMMRGTVVRVILQFVKEYDYDENEHTIQHILYLEDEWLAVMGVKVQENYHSMKWSR